jgi:hypothetical protein
MYFLIDGENDPQRFAFGNSTLEIFQGKGLFAEMASCWPQAGHKPEVGRNHGSELHFLDGCVQPDSSARVCAATRRYGRAVRRALLSWSANCLA